VTQHLPFPIFPIARYECMRDWWYAAICAAEVSMTLTEILPKAKELVSDKVLVAFTVHVPCAVQWRPERRGATRLFFGEALNAKL
jgi:hypothetical protein